MITRDELLTKLAVECEEWDDAIKKAVDIEMQCGLAIKPLISKNDWISERERLLNKPDWPDDAEWQWRSIDKNGKWYFYKLEPSAGRLFDFWFSSDDFLLAGTAYKIPAGYDWCESLEKRPQSIQEGVKNDA